MSFAASHTAQSLSRSHRMSVLGFVVSIVNLWRSRQQLKTLDDAMLADIGLSARDAQKEAQRPIWDVPSHWVH
ncbi:MAG: DUF1127 domain-containing protein [Sulfitobacter sp.]